MYKHENIPEPIREGWWWPKGHNAPRYCWKPPGCVWSCSVHGNRETPRFSCSDVSDAWTGPIPAPPAPSDDKDERLRDLADDLVDGSFYGVDDAKAATSEDEGEKWGKRFHALTPLGSCRFPWGDKNEHSRGRWRDAALRFRAECVKEFEEVVRAARAYLGVMGGDGTDGDGAEEYHDLEVALSALPAQGERPDRYRQLVDAGREILLASRGYGDIAGGTFKTPEDLQAAERKVNSEVGLAIEHIDDALDALAEQGEAPKDKTRMSDEELGHVALSAAAYARRKGGGMTEDKMARIVGAAIREKLDREKGA